MRSTLPDSRISGLAASLVLGTIAVLVLFRSGQALVESVIISTQAAAHFEETLGQAQDRLFGREYMQSIRRVKDLVDESATLFLIDGQTSERGANYFLVYFLAPRQIVRIGSSRKLSVQRLARNVPTGDHWILISRDVGEPVDIRRAADYKLELERGGSTPD